MFFFWFQIIHNSFNSVNNTFTFFLNFLKKEIIFVFSTDLLFLSINWSVFLYDNIYASAFYYLFFYIEKYFLFYLQIFFYLITEYRLRAFSFFLYIFPFSEYVWMLRQLNSNWFLFSSSVEYLTSARISMIRNQWIDCRTQRKWV